LTWQYVVTIMPVCRLMSVCSKFGHCGAEDGKFICLPMSQHLLLIC